MNRKTSGHRPLSEANLFETKYLMSTVGPTLALGLAEIIERRPQDPIEYLATFLYRQADIARSKQQKEVSTEQLGVKQKETKEKKRRSLRLPKKVQTQHEKELSQCRQSHAERLIKESKPFITAINQQHKDISLLKFGDTKLHRQALKRNANLLTLLNGSYHAIASRNNEGKTPRDVAMSAHIQENVSQIDDFCIQLLINQNMGALVDLIICGYTDMVDQLKQYEHINDNAFDFVNREIPQLLTAVQELRQAIAKGNMKTTKNILDRYEKIAFYRNTDGSTSIHEAIKHQQFRIALYLIENYPSLALVRDIHNRTSTNLLDSINNDDLNDEQFDTYFDLRQVMNLVTASLEMD